MLALPQPLPFARVGRTLFPTQGTGSSLEQEFRSAEGIARDLRAAGLVPTWKHIRVENAVQMTLAIRRGLLLGDLRLTDDFTLRDTVRVQMPAARVIHARTKHFADTSSGAPILLPPPARLALPAPCTPSSDALAAEGITANLIDAMTRYAAGQSDEQALLAAFVAGFKVARGLGSSATRPTPQRFNRRHVESQFQQL